MSIKSSLIIFDCDGTLVDSENLYNAITAELLNGLGFDEYTPELCVELFAGQAWGSIKAVLEDKHGVEIPASVVQDFIRLSHERMDSLKHVEGADIVLREISKTHPICVASNGERNGVFKSLNVTGLMQHFDENRIFTKIQVERPKPSPDLFMFAAEKMGHAPAQCLVIEDSQAGVAAAKAAGMHCLGFVGCAHDRDKQAHLLKDAGADHITDSLIHILEHTKSS